MPVRKDFSQQELLQAIQGYLKNKKARIAQATEAAVEWKFADDVMWSAEPLHEFFGFRGSNKWERAERKWLPSEMPGCYRHGFDAQGRLRIAERKDGPTIFIEYGKDQIDEMRYWRERSTFLRRCLQEKGVTQVMYQYHLDPHQYRRVDYQYDEGRCIQSVGECWYE